MFELFLVFAKIGVMTFGGGLAMLPMLERELVDNKKWISQEELYDFYAIGQCTPGIIAVNVATMVGKKQKGLLGAISATLGIVFPSLVIITILAAFFTHFAENEIVQHAFAGARLGVVAVVFKAATKLVKNTFKKQNNLPSYLIFAGSFLAAVFFKVSPAIIAITAIVLGLILFNQQSEGGKSK